MSILKELLEVSNSTNYFHITPIKNKNSILSKGLLASYSGSCSELSKQGVYFTTDVDKLVDFYNFYSKGSFIVFRLISPLKYYFYSDENYLEISDICFYTRSNISPLDLEVYGYVENGEFKHRY